MSQRRAVSLLFGVFAILLLPNDGAAAVTWMRTIPFAGCAVDYDQTVDGGGGVLIDRAYSYYCPFVADDRASRVNSGIPNGYTTTEIYVDWASATGATATATVQACWMEYDGTFLTCSTASTIACAQSNPGCDTSVTKWPSPSDGSWNYYWVQLTNVSANARLLGIGVTGAT